MKDKRGSKKEPKAAFAERQSGNNNSRPTDNNIQSTAGDPLSNGNATRSNGNVPRTNGAKPEKSAMKKSPVFYVIMLFVWSALAAGFWYQIITTALGGRGFILAGEDLSDARYYAALTVIILNGVFISYFWLNGVKDFIYVVWYYVFRGAMYKRYLPVLNTDVSGANDRVLLVYCTCNDFDGSSLIKSMGQSYGNFQTVILDDSSDPEYKAAVDKFSAEHGVRVVRRADRKGFKAGNINNFLLSEEGKKMYDYAVILDSDEILPPDFITSCLKYFYSFENVGIVQASHVSTRNGNFFMRLFHIGVNAHWPTYQTMKHFYGFSTMLGHGAMIKRECYEKAGGFPPLVAEDLCLSIAARNAGYYVAFAPNIVCEEEYPVDYVAFKKRHSKWTQGNLEFIKRFTGKIFRSPMKWYEKLDIVLFTYNLPLTAVFAFFILMNLTAAPLIHVNLHAVYPLWMVIPTVVFFFSPMLNDFIRWAFCQNPLRTLAYSVCVILLYGSMLTTSLISALLGMLGKKATFIVTPKTSEKMTLGFALRFQWKEFALSSALLCVAIVSGYFGAGAGFTPLASVFSVILIIATGYLSIILLFFSNRKYAPADFEAYDRKTTLKTLKYNKLFNYEKGK